MLPFLIGLAIGAALTKNKAILYLLLSILAFRILFTMMAKKINNVKEATDKKMAIRNETVKSINSVIDVTEYGNEAGGRWFDKFYGNYTFTVNSLLLIYLLLLLFYGKWTGALITFIGLHTFIVLNQIVRKVKHLDNSQYLKRPPVTKGIPIGGKIVTKN